MKEKLTAVLERTEGNKRFYRLSHPIKKGYSRLRGKEVSILEAFEYARTRLKPEFKNQFTVSDSTDLICVSDANTHAERLVFPAYIVKRQEEPIYGHSFDNIEGCHTMMSRGGNPYAVYNDFVYIRLLARQNGFQFVLQ